MAPAIPVKEVGFDLAAGFQTLITAQAGIVQALNNLNTTMAAQASQRGTMSPALNQGAGGAPVGSTSLGNIGGSGSGPGSGGGNPLAGQVSSSGGSSGYSPGQGGPGFLSVIPGWSLVDNVLGFGREQRDKNARYQSIEGGPNAGGFPERVHEAIYQTSTMGIFSGQEASQAFYGATQLGYNNRSAVGSAGRQNALDYIYGSKMDRGQDVGTSLQQLDAASKVGLTNFKQLTAALNDLADVAGQAGLNTQQAAAMYMNNFGLAASRGLGANGSLTAASGMTRFQAGLGQAGAGLDLSGQLSTSQDFMTASAAGISYGDYKASQLGDGKVAAGARTVADIKHIQGMLPAALITYIKTLIKGVPRSMITGGYAQGLANSALAKMYKMGMTEQAFLTQAQAMLGISSSKGANGVMVDIIAQLAGDNAANNMPTGSDGLASGNGQNLGINPDSHGTVTAGSKGGQTGAYSQKGGQQSDAGAAYASEIKGGMSRSGGIESLFAATNYGDQQSMMVAVQTSSGWRKMSLKDAMKNFPAEVASGNVQVVSGKGAGGMLGAMMNGHADTSDSNLAAVSAEIANKDLGKMGDAYSTPNDGNSVNVGGIQVTLSQQAQQLLQLLPGNHDTAHKHGQPVDPSDRPT